MRVLERSRRLGRSFPFSCPWCWSPWSVCPPRRLVMNRQGHCRLEGPGGHRTAKDLEQTGYYVCCSLCRCHDQGPEGTPLTRDRKKVKNIHHNSNVTLVKRPCSMVKSSQKPRRRFLEQPSLAVAQLTACTPITSLIESAMDPLSAHSSTLE